MTAKDRFERVMGIVDVARTAELHERMSLINELCQDDAELRSEVESLLQHEKDDCEVIAAIEKGDGPALFAEEIIGQIDDTPQTTRDHVPEFIGRFRILREIGRGGMGIVYEAEQESPKRRVALKVIRAGHISHGLNRRLEREAFVLGQLQHAGIAHIYESGMVDVDGQVEPFFAMELITGDCISSHVRENGLTIRQQLELMARVCDAVHHAHQKGIIHRDLKPANILVVAQSTEESLSRNSSGSAANVDVIGQPKILDFGVARFTDADVQMATLQTEVGQLVGTLSYMSPEQVTGRSEEVDHRSDIYALGVLLYELLSGHRPHDVRDHTVPEAARIIRDEEPSRLGSVRSEFRGDIETIAAKAMEKDTARRYQAAAEMATDIRRFLQDQPILARPASTFYQLSKFARRNKALVGGVVMTILVLTAGLTTSGALLFSVTQERDAKQVALETATAVTEFFTDMLSEATPEGAGKDVTVRQMMDAARESMGDEFVGKPLVEAKIRSTMGTTYVSLGELDTGREQLERANLLLTGVHGPHHGDIYKNRKFLAYISFYEDDYERARIGFDTLIADATNQNVSGFTIAEALAARAVANIRLDRFEAAKEDLVLAISEFTELEGPESPKVLDTRSYLAELYSRVGSTEAEPTYRDLIALSKKVRGEHHSETLVLQGNFAKHLQREQRQEEAIKILFEVHTGQAKLHGDAHRQTLITVSNLAQCLADVGRVDEAIDLCQAGLRVSDEENGEQSPTSLFLNYTLGIILRKTDRIEETERALKRTVELHKKVNGEAASTTWTCEAQLISHYINTGKYQTAIDLSEAMRDRGVKQYGESNARIVEINYNVGRSFLQLGDFGKAETNLLAAAEHANRRWLPDIKRRLVEVYEATGRPDEAEKWRSTHGD